MLSAPMADPLVGHRLETYELGERIGAGGMGVVYRAEHRRLHQTHAVKVLPPHVAADPVFVRRLPSEARLTAALRHPNIVLVYDYGEEAGLLYVAMQYLPGLLVARGPAVRRPAADGSRPPPPGPSGRCARLRPRARGGPPGCQAG